MKLLTEAVKKIIPPLRSTEGQSDPDVVVKFFDPTSSWTWYVIEGEPLGDDNFEFYGLVDGFEKELGYFTLNELEHAKDGIHALQSLPIERDLHFTTMKLSSLKSTD